MWLLVHEADCGPLLVVLIGVQLDMDEIVATKLQLFDLHRLTVIVDRD